MEPRLSFVTLGVADIARARAFYDKLGFRASSASNPDVVFYEAGGVAGASDVPAYRELFPGV